MLYASYCLSVYLLLSLILLFRRIAHSPYSDDNPSKIIIVPESNYHFTDLDQAVAYGAGLATIVVSVYTVIARRMLGGATPWEQFEEWRDTRRTLALRKDVEKGLSDELTFQLKNVDEKVKDLLRGPERAIIDETWQRFEEKRRAELMEGGVSRLLRDSGFL